MKKTNAIQSIKIPKQIKKYGKIAAILVLGYLLAVFAGRIVFYHNTPQVRDNIPGYMVYKLHTLVQNTPFEGLSFYNEGSTPTMEDLKQYTDYIAPGIYGASIEGKSYTKIEYDEIVWQSHTIELSNGEVVTIEVPQGQRPPLAEEIEQGLSSPEENTPRWNPPPELPTGQDNLQQDDTSSQPEVTSPTNETPGDARQ